MRDLMLDQIEDFRIRERNFTRGTMRWGGWYITVKHGAVHYENRKAANRSNTGAIHLSETTRKTFADMEDEILLDTYTLMVRQLSKQM